MNNRLHLAGLTLVLLLTASTAAVRADTATNVDTYLSHLVPLGFSGNVLVAEHGKIVLEKGYGLSDREHGIAVTPQTVMTVGSITKQFTAAAILKLEMQGKLHVTDSIARYLPNVPPDKAAITIHQLLTHTAGLAADYGPGDYEPVDRATYLTRVLRAPLQFRPGERFFYSNAGYNVAAAIVELVSGKPYERYLHDNVFVPAGMLQTGRQLVKWTPAQIAVGYQDGQRWGTMPSRWAANTGYWNQLGSGGIQSTPHDMYRWHVALMHNTVLSASARKKFETGYVQSGPTEKYGYGWGVQQSPYGLLVTHNGGNGIFFADFLRFLDRDTVIYIASNESQIPATLISRSIARIAFNEPVEVPPAIASLAPGTLAAHAGTYHTSSGGKIEVVAQESGLLISSDDPAIFAALGSPLLERVARGIMDQTNAFIRNRGPLDANDHPNWQALIDRNGALASATILGATAAGEDPAVWIVAHFANATKFVQLLWSPEGLAGVRGSQVAPAFAFHPETADRFFSYNPALASITHATFAPDGSLTITSGMTTLQASRQ